MCCSSAAAAASTSETKELFSAVMASSAGDGRHDVVFQCVRSPDAEMYALLHLGNSHNTINNTLKNYYLKH